MFKVHLFLDDQRIANRRMQHIPGVGEMMQFPGDRYGTVSEVWWRMDEDTDEGQRVNISVKTLKTKE